MLSDYDKPECPPLQVFASMRKCKEAGVLITFYVKNVIVNNTDQRLLIFYSNQQQLPAAGQICSPDNSMVMLNDVRLQSITLMIEAESLCLP